MDMPSLQKLLTLLEAAQHRNSDLQKECRPGSSNWHGCETVDDKLHDALAIVETAIEEATPE